eukprot:5929613-Prymnesium_polylepis.1
MRPLRQRTPSLRWAPRKPYCGFILQYCNRLRIQSSSEFTAAEGARHASSRPAGAVCRMESGPAKFVGALKVALSRMQIKSHDIPHCPKAQQIGT